MSGTIELVSPIDGSVYLTRAALSGEAARVAASRGRAAQAAWAARPLAERVAILREACALVGRDTDRMARELAHQMGRPVRYGGEFGGFAERLEHMAGIAEGALADRVVEDSGAFRRLVRRVPWGVVLVVAPWNYPWMTAINTVAPALIAGNAVILKHAAQTLQVGERLAEALHSAGVPEEVFQNLVLGHETTADLISGRHVDFVNFTGSVAGGRAMERAAAGTFLPVATELGGKDAGYVRADADLAAAVDTLMDGAMYNAGQCCCGIERVYVDRALYAPFVERAVAWAEAQVLGDPLDPATTMGPMAHVRFARTARRHVEDAVARGATAHVARMAADDGAGAYVTPQVLTGVSHDMPVMREETFGPVVGIMPVDGDEEAVALINDSDFGLTASIWTADPSAAERIGDRLEVGTVMMNRCDYLDPALCWTGCKDTGRGQGLGELGYQALTRPKSYHLRIQT
jgi:acyl-CoA reductase-like NAD-dependent aldehyde dehydrogenase